MALATAESFDTQLWYVAHCQRLKEWRAAAALENLLGLTVYLPEIQRRSHGQVQRMPFFPCYLFVCANMHEIAPSKINATPGVIRLITIDQQPLAIATNIVEHIRIHVNELAAQGALLTHSFRPGDTVRLKTGPFRGLEAAFLGPMKPSERVRVLIDFLGSLREADVHVDDLEASAVAIVPAPRQERRSRGRGRPIARIEN